MSFWAIRTLKRVSTDMNVTWIEEQCPWMWSMLCHLSEAEIWDSSDNHHTLCAAMVSMCGPWLIPRNLRTCPLLYILGLHFNSKETWFSFQLSTITTLQEVRLVLQVYLGLNTSEFSAIRVTCVIWSESESESEIVTKGCSYINIQNI